MRDGLYWLTPLVVQKYSTIGSIGYYAQLGTSSIVHLCVGGLLTSVGLHPLQAPNPLVPTSSSSYRYGKCFLRLFCAGEPRSAAWVDLPT